MKHHTRSYQPAPRPSVGVSHWPHPASRPPDSEPSVRPTAHAASALIVPVLAGLLLAGVLVATLLVGGGQPVTPAEGLSDPGPFTGWGIPVVDLTGRLLAVLTVGQLAYAALLVPAARTATAVGALRGASWSASGWLVAELAAVMLTASSVYGVPVTDLSMPPVLAVFTQLPAGRAALWVGVLLAVVIVGSAVLAGRAAGGRRGQVRGPDVVLLLASLGAVVVPVALAGHSAAAEDHLPGVVALSVHVVTASLWVGGLAGLLLHGRHGAEVLPSVRRFSALALGCVVLLLVSGAVATLIVAGPPARSWTGEGWVRLLLLKTALLGLLAAMGWWHRRRTLPALAASRPRAFLRLAIVEVALMTVTIAVSVALAASPPPEPSIGATAPVSDASPSEDGSGPAGTGPRDDAAGVDPDAAAGAPVPPSTSQGPVEDMSGHDHGDLSVSILVDADRFHVAGTVRPGQPVTVYNSSNVAATIRAIDGSFDVAVPARALITFTAPAEAGD